MVDDCPPCVRSNKKHHQEIEQSKQVNVYRANAFIPLVVWFENVFDMNIDRFKETTGLIRVDALIKLPNVENKKNVPSFFQIALATQNKKDKAETSSLLFLVLIMRLSFF